MENFILLMLFTYPGAISYWVYTRCASDKTFYVEPDSFSRTAISCFCSIVVTVLTLLVSSLFYHIPSISGLTKCLTETNKIWFYVLASLGVSVFVGFLWYAVYYIRYEIDNKRKKESKKSPAGLYKSVWVQLLKEYEIGGCIVIIRRKGRIVRMGFPQIIPDEITSDCGIVLSYCDEVESEYTKENNGLIQELVYSYYDIHYDVELEFLNAKALAKAISKKKH